MYSARQRAKKRGPSWKASLPAAAIGDNLVIGCGVRLLGLTPVSFSLKLGNKSIIVNL